LITGVVDWLHNGFEMAPGRIEKKEMEEKKLFSRIVPLGISTWQRVGWVRKGREPLPLKV
jgi:hypothetical protein